MLTSSEAENKYEVLVLIYILGILSTRYMYEHVL